MSSDIDDRKAFSRLTFRERRKFELDEMEMQRRPPQQRNFICIIDIRIENDKYIICKRWDTLLKTSGTLKTETVWIVGIL